MNLAYVAILQLLWIVYIKLFQTFQFLLWYCNGTYSRIQESFKSSSYKGSVQVLTIWARHKFGILDQPSGANNFLLVHKEFVDPEYVLEDHISLYYITKDEAVFVEAEKGVDMTSSKYGPFCRYSQFHCAKRLAIMPMQAFHRLGECIGKTKGKIIFLCNTSRCGSTLVTQVFEETGSSVTYSQPDAFTALTQLKGVVTEEERDRIVRNSINLLCKPLHYKDVKSYVLKINTLCMVEMPHILKMFPDSHVIFIYRDGLKCSKSLAKICREIPSLAVMFALGHLSGRLTKKTIELMGFPADQYEIRLLSRLHFGAIVWCVAVKQYIDFRKSGLRIAGLRYDDIVEDTTFAFQKMFEYCGLPYDPIAVEKAMGRDSQRETPLSVQNLTKYKEEEFTMEIKKHVDILCDQAGLPHFEESFVAPGTISFRDKNRNAK